MSKLLKLVPGLFLAFVFLFTPQVRAQITEPPGQLVDLGGYQLHFQVMGTGEKTIVIEPGTGSWSLHWLTFQKALSKEFRVVTYDRAGYGWSEASPFSRTAVNMADELKLGLSELGIDGPYILLGHSYGGLVMRAFGKQYPELTEAIILADAASENQFDQLPPEVNGLLQAGKQQFRELGLKARKSELPAAYMPIDSALDGSYWKAYQWSITRASYYEAMFNELDLLTLTEDQALVTGPFSFPVLVISAGNSFESFANAPDLPIAKSNEIWSVLQKRLLELSEDSEHKVLENATHDLLLSAFDELKDAVNSFVNDL